MSTQTMSFLAWAALVTWPALLMGDGPAVANPAALVGGGTGVVVYRDELAWTAGGGVQASAPITRYFGIRASASGTAAWTQDRAESGTSSGSVALFWRDPDKGAIEIQGAGISGPAGDASGAYFVARKFSDQGDLSFVFGVEDKSVMRLGLGVALYGGDLTRFGVAASGTHDAEFFSADVALQTRVPSTRFAFELGFGIRAYVPEVAAEASFGVCFWGGAPKSLRRLYHEYL